MGEPALDRERLRDCGCVGVGAAGVEDDLLHLFRGRCSLASAVRSTTEAEVLGMQSTWGTAQEDESRLRRRTTSRVSTGNQRQDVHPH